MSLFRIVDQLVRLSGGGIAQVNSGRAPLVGKQRAILKGSRVGASRLSGGSVRTPHCSG